MNRILEYVPYNNVDGKILCLAMKNAILSMGKIRFVNILLISKCTYLSNFDYVGQLNNFYCSSLKMF